MIYIRLNKITIIFLVTILFNSCVERINLNIPQGEEKLVIEGMITNQPGPYRIKLSKSLPDLSEKLTQENVETVSFAEVSISDDLGTQVRLEEVAPGTYETTDESFVGEIGRTYTLTVEIGTEKYVSSAEIMKAVTPISDLYYELTRIKYFNENNVELDKPYFDIYVDVENNLGESLNLGFEWKGVYEFESNPRGKTTVGHLPHISLPDPYDCSGYVYTNGEFQRINDCSCCTCWGTIFSPSVKALQLANGTQKKRVKIATIFIDHFQFQRKFQLKVSNYSLSDAAYSYWRLIEDQNSITGSIFDNPLGKIQGNIKNITSPDEEVLGFFGASAVEETSIIINRNDVQVDLKLVSVYDMRYPCTQYPAPHITNIKPNDW